jgi:hypothetical protein
VPRLALREREPTTHWHEHGLYSKQVVPNRLTICRQILAADADLDPVPDGTIGYGLGIADSSALVRFGSEGGLHEFKGPAPPDEAANRNAFVQVFTNALLAVLPDERFARKGAIEGGSPRRIYDYPADRIWETVLDVHWFKLRGNLAEDMPVVIDANMRHRLTTMILE